MMSDPQVTITPTLVAIFALAGFFTGIFILAVYWPDVLSVMLESAFN